MTLDALWPGPDWDYPNAPRDEAGYLDVVRMPIRPHWQKGVNGESVWIDPTPTVRDRDGRLVKITEIVPPPPEDAA